MDFPFEIYTGSVEETENIGRCLSEMLEDELFPPFVAMYGDLGVGKTAFVRGFCSVRARGANVKSPTFALVNDYRCVTGRYAHIYHFDMYRITSEDDLYSIGFYDYLDEDALFIVEWSEQIEYALPEEYIEVKIDKTDGAGGRRIRVALKKME